MISRYGGCIVACNPSCGYAYCIFISVFSGNIHIKIIKKVDSLSVFDMKNEKIQRCV